LLEVFPNRSKLSVYLLSLGTDGLSEIVTELEMYHQKLYEWTYFIEE